MAPLLVLQLDPGGQFLQPVVETSSQWRRETALVVVHHRKHCYHTPERSPIVLGRPLHANRFDDASRLDTVLVRGYDVATL